MRVRSAIKLNDWMQSIGGSLSAGTMSQYYASLYSSASGSLREWGYNPGDYYSHYANMQDELTPVHEFPRPVHACYHTKYVPAKVVGSRVCEYPTPAPSLYMSVSFPFMYKPSLILPSGPWATMLDELASLASGNTQNSAMLPVTFLEGAKTIAMLRNPFNLLKPSFRRKVRKLTAASLASASSKIWLESYYGWKSFYQDTTTIAKATALFLSDDHLQKLEQLGKRLTARSSSDTFHQTDYGLGTSASDWATRDNNAWRAWDGYKWVPYSGKPMARLVNLTTHDSYVIGCRQFMEASDRVARTKKFLGLSGLSSWRSIRDTIWEVIPFSFVVDWFVDSRGLWAPLNRWRLGQEDITSLCYSTHRTQSYDVDIYIRPDPFYDYIGCPWARARCTSVLGPSVFRSVSRGECSIYSRSVGLPLSDEVALFGAKGLSFIRTINGSALITQLLTSKKK